MRKVKGFIILEGDEIPSCQHEKWQDVERFVPVNPNGEYVEGYGYTPVYVSDLTERRCISCGLIEKYREELPDVTVSRIIPA